MAGSRSLLLVHAHPDDECLTTGGAMAKYAAEGVHVCLVTCTNGELGEIAEGVDVDPDVLGELRREELRDACQALGVTDVRMLGFRDSGMDGTDGNTDPASFVNQDLEATASRIADVMREVRPQVVVTYDETGFYGHPDHIRAHQAAVRALEMTSDDLPPPKLYYCVYPKSILRAFRDGLAERGVPDDGFLDEESIEFIGTDDALVTTELDVSAFVDAKVRALEAHRSQRGTTGRFIELPDDVRPVVLGAEWYQLARSPFPAPEARESDLFEGIDG